MIRTSAVVSVSGDPQAKKLSRRQRMADRNAMAPEKAAAFLDIEQRAFHSIASTSQGIRSVQDDEALASLNAGLEHLIQRPYVSIEPAADIRQIIDHGIEIAQILVQGGASAPHRGWWTGQSS